MSTLSTTAVDRLSDGVALVSFLLLAGAILGLGGEPVAALAEKPE